MTSKEMLGQLMDRHYADAMRAKEEGRLVAWATSISPQELLETMDITVVYPENHAAAIGARKCAPEFISCSEGEGYSSDLCSYARVNLGYMDIKESIAGNIPMPDVIFCCNNICNTVIKWYENIAKELNIPMILFDLPFNHEYEVTEQNVQYIRSQLEDAIHVLEKLTGRPFDYEKLGRVMEISSQTAKMWKKASMMARSKPSPLNGFDLFNYMALIVCARARDYAEITFHKFADELEAKDAAGQYAFGAPENEKHRVTWEGIAVWTYLGATFKGLKNQGAVMTGSAYPGLWSLVYTPGDLESMAEAYTNVYINTCGPNRYEEFYKVVKNSKSDGIVLHLNRSCKLMGLLNNEGAEYVNAKLGVPYVSFDGDQTDPRVFTPAQYETRVQALTEMMDENQ